MAKSWDNINESLREIIRMLQDLIAKEDSRVINLVSSESVHDRDISIAGETNGADAKTTSFIPIVTNVKDHVCNGFSSEALPNPVKRMPNVIKSLTSRLDSGEAFLIRHEAATAHVQELIPEKDNQRGQMIQVYEVKGMQKKLRSLGPRSDPGGIVHIRGRPAIDSDQELKEFGKVNDVANDETVVGQANKITITNGKWMFSKKQIERIVRDASRSKVENEEHKKKVKMKFQLGSIPWQQYLPPNLGFDFHGNALSPSSSVWGFDGHGVHVLEDCLNMDDRETAQNLFDKMSAKHTNSWSLRIDGHKKKKSERMHVKPRLVDVSFTVGSGSGPKLKDDIQDTPIHKVVDEEHRKNVKMKDPDLVLFHLGLPGQHNHGNNELEYEKGKRKPLEAKIGDGIQGNDRDLDGRLILKAARIWKEFMLRRIVQLLKEVPVNKPGLPRWFAEFDEHYMEVGFVLLLDHGRLIDAASWIKAPWPYQSGVSSFDAGEALAMMMLSLPDQQLYVLLPECLLINTLSQGMLTEVMDDKVGISCRFVKGQHYTSCVDDAMNYVMFDNGREYSVDLMAGPNTLIPYDTVGSYVSFYSASSVSSDINSFHVMLSSSGVGSSFEEHYEVGTFDKISKFMNFAVIAGRSDEAIDRGENVNDLGMDRVDFDAERRAIFPWDGDHVRIAIFPWGDVPVTLFLKNMMPYDRIQNMNLLPCVLSKANEILI